MHPAPAPAPRPSCSGTSPGSPDALLRHAINRLGFSARAYHRILKIARTIADLGGARDIATAHVAEAIQYRSLDRLMRG